MGHQVRKQIDPLLKRSLAQRIKVRSESLANGETTWLGHLLSRSDQLLNWMSGLRSCVVVDGGGSLKNHPPRFRDVTDSIRNRPGAKKAATLGPPVRNVRWV